MWRVIPSFPDYEASDAGHVRRCRPGARQNAVRPLSPFVEDNGYVSVTLWVDGGTKKAWLHRLVCEAFHGPAPAPNLDAAHGNNVRSDNRADNLSWKTRAGNELDKLANGTSNIGERNGGAKLSAEQARTIKSRVTALPRSSGGVRVKKGALAPLAAEYGVTVSCIRQIADGRRWSTLS